VQTGKRVNVLTVQEGGMEKQRVPLFYRIATIFSLLVSLVLVAVVIALPFVLRPILSDVLGELNNLENAVITTTVVVDQPMPVQGTAIQVLEPLTVTTVAESNINAAYVTMYLGNGSQVAGTTYIVVPAGTELPIDFRNRIIMSTTIPVKLSIPVSIPLKDTQVGAFAANLKEMLRPITDLLGVK
jgi:hypothetical protein